MEAVINNTKLIRRVNIFALLILAVCVCAVAFLCKNMWLHIACTAALFLVMTIFGYWGKGLKFLVPPFFRGVSGGCTNGKQGKCSHTCYFCIPAGCKNACWGASPNPALGHFVPK